MNPYIGHDSQICGIEEHRLVGGKGDGMRLLEITNGQGLQITLSPDRCCDISRLRFLGRNMGYLNPCGHVAPAYYDATEDHWLKSFTAGFLTTCGLETVGTPSVDEGEYFSLHGTIANQPCEHVYWTTEEDKLIVNALIKDENIFSRKLRLQRRISISTKKNEFEVEDTIINTGDSVEPIMLLYHMNMGYPLLDEESVVSIPSIEVKPRNAHAEDDLENWRHMQKPTAGYVERCYYHRFADENGSARIFQPKLGIELGVGFNTNDLDGFTEWKMMGVRDYVLGLEPGNCYPDGRKTMREKGMLKFLEPNERKTYRIHVWLNYLEENRGINNANNR